MAKADANVKIVYLCENGRIETQNASIPIMSFIDIDKVAEGHICNTEYFVRNMLNTSFIRLCVTVIVSVICVALSGYFVALSKNERQWIVGIVKSKLGKK